MNEPDNYCTITKLVTRHKEAKKKNKRKMKAAHRTKSTWLGFKLESHSLQKVTSGNCLARTENSKFRVCLGNFSACKEQWQWDNGQGEDKGDTCWIEQPSSIHDLPPPCPFTERERATGVIGRWLCLSVFPQLWKQNKKVKQKGKWKRGRKLMKDTSKHEIHCRHHQGEKKQE